MTESGDAVVMTEQTPEEGKAHGEAMTSAPEVKQEGSNEAEPGTEPGVQKDSGEGAPIEGASMVAHGQRGEEEKPEAHDQREEEEQKEPHDQKEEEEEQKEPQDQREEEEQQEAHTQDTAGHVEVPGESGEGGEPTEQPGEGGDVTEQEGEEEKPMKEGEEPNAGEKREQFDGPPEAGMEEGALSPNALHPATCEETANEQPQPEEVQAVLEVLQSPSALPLQPTPLEDILEEDEEEEEIDREAIIQEVKEALAEQDRLKSVKLQLQHKIAEYLARKKTEERPDPGRNVTDQEKRYAQCMAALDSLQEELLSMQVGVEQQERELKALRDHKLAQVNQAAAGFAAYKRDKALTAVYSRSGKRLTSQEVEHYLSQEGRKEQEVVQVRLENIKLQNKIQKQDTLIKQKEQLAEGLHMIDFEQLKINNMDLNEKIEERNEDILKLKRKVTSTVQVLTHVKEKLQFLQAENSEKRAKLREIEAVVAKKRDHLTRMKQARDSLRTENLRLRQKGGLVCHSGLLRDFEEKRDQSEELRAKLEALQQRHSELTVLCDGLRKRIEQARTMYPHM